MIGFIVDFVFMVWFCLKGRIPTPHSLASNEQKQSGWFFTSQSYEPNSKQTSFSLEKLRISLFFFFSYEVESFAHRWKMFLFIGAKRFAYRWKTFCSSMKKERGTSFLRQPKTGTNVTSKFSSSSSSFLSTFSLTPIGVLFVCSFVCLRAREEAYVKCSFASLYNTFFGTQKMQFLQHNLHTVFAHNFCIILHTFLIQFWLHFWCKLENFSDTFLSTNLQSKFIDLFFKK